MHATRRSIPTRLTLVGLLLLLIHLPAAAAQTCSDPLTCPGGGAPAKFEEWWNSVDPVSFVSKLISGAITRVFDVLEEGVSAVFYWLSYPFRALYGAATQLFGKIGTTLSNAAQSTIGAIGHAFSSVTLGILRAVPALGPVAPLVTALLFTGTAAALVMTVSLAIGAAKNALPGPRIR